MPSDRLDDTMDFPVRPVDVPGPLSADLHRWYCGPYCPKCGFIDDDMQHAELADAPGQDGREIIVCSTCRCETRPGLHTRCPETRVEGLMYMQADWFLTSSTYALPVSVAADLLVQGVVKDAIKAGHAVDFGADLIRRNRGHVICKIGDAIATAPTLPEAVAIAQHRAADAEGQG